jgi:hypothetical protein
LKSISDFQILIAIAIPIKNCSGKIGDRFSFQNRSAMKKPLALNFHSRNDKSGSDSRTKIDQRFPDQNRIAISIFESGPEIFFDRDHEPDQKKNPEKSGFDFHFEIGSRFFYNRPCQSPPRPKPHPHLPSATVTSLNMTSSVPAGERPFIPARIPRFSEL